jgi:serine/threonine-protein kinase
MPIPSKFGRYEIKSELGRGGMATVYRAYDPLFDREVALKVLPREMLHDPHCRTRFDRELKIVAGLEHPAIVPVYDVGEEDGQPYFVMRYMSGGSLAGEIEKGRFSLEDAARIIEKVAQGLTYAHKKGIVHRDLKPDNILFDNTGSPFISDFGVAKLTESTSSLTGSGVIGTPAYMSPEQAQGVEIDSRSDVYGLGVIVYQMLSGQQPYSADTPMGVVVKHITEPVPEILKTLPSLPYDVDQVIKTSMAKDKTKRYSTTVDLARALNVVAFGNEGNVTSANITGVRTGVFKPASSTTAGSSRPICHQGSGAQLRRRPAPESP